MNRSQSLSLASPPPAQDDSLGHYRAVRQFSRTLCEPLATEDYVIQSMPDVSPTRWHLAHTTWFFETFVLERFAPDYRVYDESFRYLFNSYYNAVGDQYPRARRGLLSRPTVREVWEYREYVDEHIEQLLDNGIPNEVAETIELGLHHERQHQELMLTDIKHVFSCNPLLPRYIEDRDTSTASSEHDTDWIEFDDGLFSFGHSGDAFSYDNECPRHRAFLESFRLADGLVTNREYLAFIEDGGYDRPELWLSLGWAAVSEQKWQAPLYWRQGTNGWQQFTLSGLQPLMAEEPVCHVSYFEADAFARWSGKRLATEYEWERAAQDQPVRGNFAEQLRFHPMPINAESESRQLFGDVWEWTSSHYSAYPGYQAPEGALGEYNGKFMCGQFVLRGGSCATSSSHIRPTYRNFFPPETRWQFSGIRLCE